MKILYVLNSGSQGGMEYHVLDLIEGMVGKGHEVFVWCPEGSIVKEYEEAGAGERITHEKIRMDIDPIYICRLRKFLKNNKIDVVHAHELKAVSNAMIAAWLAGVKCRVSHTHTPISEWKIDPIKKKLNICFYKKLVNVFSTHEIALTESRKRIKMDEGIKEDKLHIIQSANAVRVKEYTVGENIKAQYKKSILERHKIPEDKIIWGCLGRQTEEKGHSVLISAFKMLIDGLAPEDKGKHRLILAGGGSLQGDLEKQVIDKGLEGRVVITGMLPYKDLIKYYSTFDYFVHPSLAEGFGLVLIEAMMVGIPVIASDLEVFYEVADGTVTYFKTGNAEDLKNTMLEVLKGEHNIKENTKRAKERVVELYSFENFTNSYHQYYLELKSK